MHCTKLLLTLGLSATLIACASHETDEARDSGQTTRTAIPAAGKAVSPDQLVRDLYRQHDAGSGPFFQDNDRALVNKYFEKELADLIWEDMTETDAGESMLDADPLYNAQDTDIKNLTIYPLAERDGAPEVRVTFNNFGTRQELRYRMVRMRGTWRISDIVYPDGSQLFQLLSGRAEEMP